MKKRVWMISGALAFGFYASMVGCGDDETEPVADDAGLPDGTSSDGQQVDTSVGDTSVADTNIADVTGDRGTEQTGQSCQVASDCYAGFDAQSLVGAATCIDNVSNGYCTHVCTQDSDCCATPGECKTGLKQVCAAFESSAVKYCFLSCEPTDIAAAADAGGGVDAGSSGDDYCHGQASTDFGCRSTGGGSGNRKVCLPTGAASDGGVDASDASTASDAADAADASDASDAPADG
jgi:hypothetical protein